MLSPRDWIERMRGMRARPRPETAPEAVLPRVLGLPRDVRELLLGLDRRGQLRRALQMDPRQAALAVHLAELVAEHGADALLQAMAVIDLPDEAAVEPPREKPPALGPGLAPEVVAQLANLNVNQWRDTRTTDGWYGPGRDGMPELFLQRSSVPPRLLKELASRGVLRREAQGASAGEETTFTVQAGRLRFRGVVSLDIEKLKAILGSSFEAIHARWDGAERKYAVTVVRGEAAPAKRDEVAHEPVT